MMAIDNEDYDAAKIIKTELEKVKRNLMSVTSLPKVRGSSMSNRSIRTPTSDIPMTPQEKMDPGRQLIHSISQIQSDLNRINYNVEKPDPMKSMNHNFSIEHTYGRPYIAPPVHNTQMQHQVTFDEQVLPQHTMQTDFERENKFE